MNLAEGYRPAIRLAVIGQSVVLVLAALMLDSGRTLRACCVAALAHWAAVVLIVTRRPSSPTPSDLALVRHGFWLMIVLIWLLTPVVWKLTGRL